jgi:ER membrane protein complex subunit 1
VALHTAYVKELDLLPYLALTTTTGAIQLWQGDIVQGTREEGLSRLQVAEMAELPERKTIASHITGQDETFVSRARRQLADAKVRFESSAVTSNVQLMCGRRGCPNMSSTLPRGL